MTRKGVGPTAVATEFGVKPPSVKDWQSFGRIHRKHWAKLVEYFKDVAGPEHWGITAHQVEQAPALKEDEIDLLNAFNSLPPDIRAKFLHDTMRFALAQQAKQSNSR